MSIVKNQQSLYNFISEKLNENSYGVEFRSDLFNTNVLDYWYLDDNGRKKRFVPVMISDVLGEYLNIPNTNSTSNTVAIQFDIFTGVSTGTDLDDEEYENVNYSNTLSAIEEFKSTLLARYFPLGTQYLYMGGEDSTVTFNTSSSYANDFIYLKAIFKNTDTETIFRGDSSTVGVLSKDATHITWQVTSGVTISVPYTVDVETEITVSFSSSNVWSITNGTNTDTVTNTAFNASTVYYLGHTTGLEAIIQRLVIDNTKDITSVDDLDGFIDISSWSSKDTVTNNGSATITSSTIENCILWSLDGNAIFSFGTLNPVSDSRVIDGSAYYQVFELEITTFISNDVLFGNNFEYKLDNITIYPIDRGHTLGTNIGAGQKINSNESEYIVEDSARDHTMSFYYIPSKKLTSLLKRIVTGDTSQNQTYNLVVQYPFFKVTYDVIIDGGGTNPNLQTLSTFTLTFKKADSLLVGV